MRRREREKGIFGMERRDPGGKKGLTGERSGIITHMAG